MKSIVETVADRPGPPGVDEVMRASGHRQCLVIQHMAELIHEQRPSDQPLEKVETFVANNYKNELY